MKWWAMPCVAVHERDRLLPAAFPLVVPRLLPEFVRKEQRRFSLNNSYFLL
jgi:hypothetical protein